MRKIIKTLIKLWLKLPYLKLGETRSYGDIYLAFGHDRQRG